MAQDPAQSARPALAQVPRVEDLPRTAGGGFEEQAVRDAFDTFRRSMLQLHAQLRVLQAAGRSGQPEPVGHSIRMDALRLIRAAAEFADVLERDAQTASAEQFGRVEEQVRRRHRELQEQEAQLETTRIETERQCLELVNAARAEARELRLAAEREAEAMTRDAEARGARLLEQARHQATELTNAARADVSQTLDWARAQATAIVSRAQQGAEQLLGAAGLGPEAVAHVTTAIVEAARAAAQPRSQPAPPPPGGGGFGRAEPTVVPPVQPVQQSEPQEPQPPSSLGFGGPFGRGAGLARPDGFGTPFGTGDDAPQ